MTFPVIDIADLDKPSSHSSIAEDVTKASKTWGFLLLKNHPIPKSDIDTMFKLAHDFFVDIPEDDKTPWPINSNYVGYNKALSDRFHDDKASMWLSAKPGSLSSALDALPPYWRQHVQQIEDFKHACHGLVIKLLTCFALALQLPEDYFVKSHAEDAGDGNRFRMICYPSRSNAPLVSTTRMSPHSDSGTVTLLFQTSPGLEVESPSGEWVPAPHIPGHILVNIGDALSFWSGGQLKATKHRVTFDGVPHDAERMSMAYFGAASPDTVLEPVKVGGGEEAQMEKYEANGVVIPRGITYGEYSKIIMGNIYGTSVAQTTVSEPTKDVEAVA